MASVLGAREIRRWCPGGRLSVAGTLRLRDAPVVFLDRRVVGRLFSGSEAGVAARLRAVGVCLDPGLRGALFSEAGRWRLPLFREVVGLCRVAGRRRRGRAAPFSAGEPEEGSG